jgi:hypothetical protein
LVEDEKHVVVAVVVVVVVHDDVVRDAEAKERCERDVKEDVKEM